MSISIRRLCRDINKEYHVCNIGGMEGMDNIVNWVHMIEDYDAVQFLHGFEVVITTGIGNIGNPENMLIFVKTLHKKNASGVIFNIGPYIQEIPKNVIQYCCENKLPLFTVPWETKLVDLTRHFCKILIEHDEKEKSLTSLVKDYIFREEDREKLYSDLTRNGFAQHLNYCVINFELVSSEKKPIIEQQKEYLHEVIEREASRVASKFVIFRHENRYVLITAGLKTTVIQELVQLIEGKHFANDEILYISTSSNKGNLINLPQNFYLSERVYKLARKLKTNIMTYDDLDMYRLLFAIDDIGVMREYKKNVLNTLVEYDEGNGSNYLDFIRNYIEKNGNIQEIASDMFVHRNTIHYKINKIKEIANIDLTQLEDVLRVQICLKIMDIL